MLNSLLLLIISFSGLFVGSFIANFTKEEIKPGKKYFTLFKRSILAILIVLFLTYNFNLIFLIFGLISAYFFRKVYLYLGLALALSFINLNHLLISNLIFIFGLPYGTLNYKLNKDSAKCLTINFLYFSLPLVILLFNFDKTMLFSFVSGALILNLK